MPYAKSVAIPEENFDNISSAITKSIEITGENICIEIVSNQLTQPVDGFTHISIADSNIDLAVPWNHHGLSPSAETAFARA